MSWFYALCTDRPDHPLSGRPPAMHASHLLTIRVPGVHLVAGGFRDTLVTSGREGGGTGGWVVAGAGLDARPAPSRLLTADDWSAVLAADHPPLDSLDGHFAIARWSSGCLECFTDQLGLRPVYYRVLPGAVCISTRPDWVAQTGGGVVPDPAVFGSSWLLVNPLGGAAGVRDVRRLGPGGHLCCRGGGVVREKDVPWEPRFGDEDPDEAEDALVSVLRGMLGTGRPVSLGLSGGLDSRLLAGLLVSLRAEFSTHTFGDPSHPDAETARRITRMLGLRHRHLDEPLPPARELLRRAAEFAAQTGLTEPVSSVVRLSATSRLGEEQTLVLDGGFGELSRRQYLNRIAWLGRAAFRNANAGRLIELMRRRRADVFTPEVIHVMEQGARSDLLRALRGLPDVAETGVENGLDLLAVRTRVPGFGGPEQSRLDNEVLDLMPLAQPSYLRRVLRLSPRRRRNGRFVREIIRRRAPLLAGPPLVKGMHITGFDHSALRAAVETRLFGFRGGRDPERDRRLFLRALEEYVRDVSASAGVRTCPLYRPGVVAGLVEDFYGRGERGGELDWWLTFHFWNAATAGVARSL